MDRQECKKGSTMDIVKLIQTAMKLAPLLTGGANPLSSIAGLAGLAGGMGQQQDSNVITEKDMALMELKKLDGAGIVLIGTRNTGKTTLAYRLAEFLARPTFAFSPQEEHIPNWITSLHEPDDVFNVPKYSTLILDDLPAYMGNQDYRDDFSQKIHRAIPMLRHEPKPPDFPLGKIYVIFNTQSSAAADRYILDCDMAFLKPLGMFGQEFERPKIAKIYKEYVNPCFDGKTDDFIHRHAFMWSRMYKGLIRIKKCS